MNCSFLLVWLILVDNFSENEEESEPDEVNNIDDDDRVELSQKVDISVEEVKASWAFLDDVAHPLMLDRLGHRGVEKVKVGNGVETSDSLAEWNWQIVWSNIYV